MKRLFVTFALLGLVALLSTKALAQSKTIPGESIVKKVSIEAINRGTRELTIKDEDGHYTNITAPDDVKRFDELKVGDVITARYYENLVLRLKQPGEKDVDTSASADTRTPAGGRPGATVADQRTITATITQIDRNIPSITFSGPNNWTYSSRVEDKKALEKVKVGDKVDIVWTEAQLVSLDAPAKK